MPDPTHPNIHTYVLIGPAQEEEYALYKDREDVTILSYDQYPTMESVATAIKPPANVILQCHGNPDATFVWKDMNDRTAYTSLFSKLPRSGILSITLGSCYGGVAQRANILASAPPGCLVQSMTGPLTLASDNQTSKFASETEKLTRPIDLYLEALDNFDPATYHEDINYWNRTNPHVDSNPLHALPHILGLGGKPPHRIDLAQEMDSLRGHGTGPAFVRAVARVQARFDTEYYRSYVDEDGVKHVKYSDSGKSLGPEAEAQLHQSVAAMAQRLAAGNYKPNPKASIDAQANELKLVYALTAAYLDESGELDHDIMQQPGYQLFPGLRRDAKGKLIYPDVPLHQNQGWWDGLKHGYHHAVKGITHDEQAYINSLSEQLDANPAMKDKKDQILKQLVTDFSVSKNNDVIDPGLIKTLQQAGINTKSWER